MIFTPIPIYEITFESERLCSGICIQGSRHYKNFTKSINDLMIEEVDFMSKIIGGHASQPIDLNQIYIENIGNIFVESISQKFI